MSRLSKYRRTGTDFWRKPLPPSAGINRIRFGGSQPADCLSSAHERSPGEWRQHSACRYQSTNEKGPRRVARPLYRPAEGGRRTGSVDQVLAIVVRTAPLTPDGKKPPLLVPVAPFRYTMLSTWLGDRTKAMPLASVGTRFAIVLDVPTIP